eukprot:Awhi_evm1s2884
MKAIFALSALFALTAAQSPCTLANIDGPGVTTFESGSRVQVTVNRSKLRTSFAGENGGPVITLDITNDTSTFFPQGLIHGQQNMGCDTVAFISSLNSADPGLQTITSNFFRLPIEGVAGSLDISAEEAAELRDGLPLNIVLTSKDQ